MSAAAALLLVDDSDDDRELTITALRDSGMANPIRIARDGQEALDLLADPDRGLPAVVLLDLNLPRIGGLDVLKRLRAQDRTRLLPVVILTSSNEESDRLRGYRDGANAYVRKPVSIRRVRPSRQDPRTLLAGRQPATPDLTSERAVAPSLRWPSDWAAGLAGRGPLSQTTISPTFRGLL